MPLESYTLKVTPVRDDEEKVTSFRASIYGSARPYFTVEESLLHMSIAAALNKLEEETGKEIEHFTFLAFDDGNRELPVWSVLLRFD